MARKGWDQLSPGYRRRLEKGGVTKADYQAGRSLKKARGHAETPERPREASANPQKYAKYISRRKVLEQRLIARKRRLWGQAPKFNSDNSKLNVREDPLMEAPPPLSLLEWADKASDSELYNALDKTHNGNVGSDHDPFSFLWYH